jgi:hypothetical protein
MGLCADRQTGNPTALRRSVPAQPVPGLPTRLSDLPVLSLAEADTDTHHLAATFHAIIVVGSTTTVVLGRAPVGVGILCANRLSAPQAPALGPGDTGTLLVSATASAGAAPHRASRRNRVIQ